MRIRHLTVENYRGIKTLDWKIDEGLVCLVGGGDSTKSTILKAINAVLSPKWNHTFNDCDFYNLDVTQPLQIVATIGNLSDEVLEKFHDFLRGIDDQGNIVAMPHQSASPAISIKLTVDSTLEPEWKVFIIPDGGTLTERIVSAKERALIGTSEIGKYIDRELTWSYGSSVSKMTGDREEVTAAFRSARQAILGEDLTELKEVSDTLQTKSILHGVTPTATYKPDLDLEQLAISSGVLCISDGDVPLRLKGLGTRRLIALAAQREAVKDTGIILVDEIENGLEPYRLRHLLKQLDQWADPSSPSPASSTTQFPTASGQVFLTTHSEIAIVQLKANNIHIVTRTSEGVVVVHRVDPTLQDIVRKTPESLLARKVIVCEGKTEYGLCLALEEYWTSQNDPCWAHLGVAPTVGNGTEGAGMALKIKSLGYLVSYFGDSDVPITPSEEDLTSADIKVVRWSDNSSIETRVITDLPWDGVVEIFTIALEEKGGPVCEKMLEYFTSKGVAYSPKDLSDIEVVKKAHDEPLVREAIAYAINQKKVFKQPHLGQHLGNVIVKYLSQIPSSDLALKIQELKTWTSS